MTADNKSDLAKILRQRRVMMPLTLQELGRAAGVSPSYIGRIERGDRFPSARILRKFAKPLNFDENELFALAGYLSPEPPSDAGMPSGGQLDPYVAAVLSQEPIEVQRAFVAILTVMKSLAKGSSCDIEFAEYVHRKYPGTDEDTIIMIQDILEHPPKS